MVIRHNYDYAVDSSKGNVTYASVAIWAQDLSVTSSTHAAMMLMLLNGVGAAFGGALCAMAYANEGPLGLGTYLAMLLVFSRHVAGEGR